MLDAISRLPVVACVDEASAPSLRAALDEGGFRIFAIEAEVGNDDALFAEAEQHLPVAPDLPVHSWDGFADVLWSGLAALEADRVAILWHRIDRVAAEALPTLLVASRVLTDVARQVSSTERGFPRETELRVFLVGRGPSFPPLTD